MARRFKGYRVDTTRARWWDYGNNAAYFITIVTQNRRRFFGQVVDGQMALSAIGEIAHRCWSAIPEHFPFVKPGAFIAMPDHVHGIVIIDKKDESGLSLQPQDLAAPSPQWKSEDPDTRPKSKNSFGPQSRNLGSVVRGFKVGVTKAARKINPGFGWQSGFNDRIIHTISDYNFVENYILSNPQNWGRKK